MAKFSDAFFSSETSSISAKALDILANLEHRPIVHNSLAHKDHLNRTLKLINSFEADFKSQFCEINTVFAEEKSRLLR